MRRISLFITAAIACSFAQAQPADSLDLAIVQRHIRFLASDSMKGRGNYTRELQQAASYIAAEFNKAGLVDLPGLTNYFQPFTTLEVPDAARLPGADGTYDPGSVLLNVIGVLPGRTRPTEVVIFSAHYDHLGVTTSRRDSIYNGANDNASGTAGLLWLMQYYAGQKNNDRTIIFCAFAGEEIGLAGSDYFSRHIVPDAVKAMINIEMIGKPGIGRKAFFITGARYSNLQDIFRKNLKGHDFRIRPDPDESKNLFGRSDNFPLVIKGVPAHTIMAGTDDDPCYHRECDEADRMDTANMLGILKAIAVGCATIINGKDTPGRIYRYTD